jgi:hypothetical protein
MWVSILVFLVNAGQPYLGYSSTQTTSISLFLLVLGLIITYLSFRTQRCRKVKADFLQCFDGYQRIVNQDAKHSAMGLMGQLMAQLSEEDTSSRGEVWKVLHERTCVITKILVQQLQDVTDEMRLLDPSLAVAEERLKVIVGKFWKILNWYHDNVIQVILQMDEETHPNRSLREDSSRFRMLYNNLLNAIRKASEDAGSDLGLDLTIGVEKLLLPGIS